MANPKKKVGVDAQGAKLPHNLEAERSVLGACLLDDQAFPRTRGVLEAGDFFLDAHRRIFGRMRMLADQERPIDLITLDEELERAGELGAAGGSAYVGSLVDGVPRVSNVEHYARIVKEKALLRRAVEDGVKISQIALQPSADSDTVLLALATLGDAAKEAVQAGVAARPTPKRIQLVSAEEFLSRTADAEQDWLVEGLLPARSQTTWQGRPKVGKSHTLLQLAFDLASGKPVFGHFPVPQPRRVLYVELEEAEAETRGRFAAMLRANGGNGPDSGMLSFFSRGDLHRSKLLSHELLGPRLQDFAQAVHDTGAELVTLVALRRLLVGDVSEPDVAERFNDALDLLAQETGAAIALVHHNRKAPAETAEARGFGSTMLAARADAVFDLRRGEGGLRRVVAEARYGVDDSFFLGKVKVDTGELIRLAQPPGDKRTAKLEALQRRIAAGESMRQAAVGEEVPFSTAQRWLAEEGLAIDPLTRI